MIDNVSSPHVVHVKPLNAALFINNGVLYMAPISEDGSFSDYVSIPLKAALASLEENLRLASNIHPNVLVIPF